MMILKVDNVGTGNELTMMILTVDVDDNVGVPGMVKQANVSAQRGQPLIHYSGKSSEVRLCQVFVCAFSVRSLKAAFKSFVE